MSQVKVGDVVKVKGDGPDHEGRVSFVQPNAEGAVNVTLEDGSTIAYDHISRNPLKGWYSQDEKEKVALIVEVTQAPASSGKAPTPATPTKP